MNSVAKFTSVFAVISILIGSSYSGRQQIGQFYFVNWDLDLMNSLITIELEVQTHGYVGFGLARNQLAMLMNEADIIICGVADGVAYLSDRHGVRNEVPAIDPTQNYQLIEASENATHTRVKFSRNLQTLDSNDVGILPGTQTVIWSFGETDDFVYHDGINRGGAMINWLAQ